MHSFFRHHVLLAQGSLVRKVSSQCKSSNLNGAGLYVFQLTTAVTSAFLLAKVILSKVRPTPPLYSYPL